MDWVEVPSTEWQTFLGRFTDEHRGWRAAIESVEPGQIPERLAEGMPLRLILTESNGAGMEDIAIVTGGDASRGRVDQLLHHVRHPRQVRFARSYFSPDAAVLIDTAGGPSTVLHVWANVDRQR